MAPFARGCVGALFEPRMSERHLDPPLEMDSLPVQSPVTGKFQGFYKLARREYAIGICLLLLVVFLWTASNFVTQVRLCNHHWPQLSYLMLATRTYSSVDTGSLSCLCHLIFNACCASLTITRHSITYLTTSTFSLYLLPFLIKSYIRRHYGGSEQTVGLG